MGFFFVAIARVVKKPFFFLFNPPLLLFLKNLFFCKKNLYTVDKETLTWFWCKQIIDSLFLFLPTYIGLNFDFKKKCLNNRANHENLDLSHFFSEIGLIKQKKTFKKLFHILLLHPVVKA